jgi:phosphate transport system substrate-binding protein
MHGSKDVVDLVAKTPCAIGYSGIAYATSEVKSPCIIKGDQCIVPSMESAIDGSYAIARPLFMYTPSEPSGASKQYIDWILSDTGQCVIKGKGYAPVRDVKCE